MTLRKRTQFKAIFISCILLVASAFASASYAVDLFNDFPDSQGSLNLYVQAFNPVTLQFRNLERTGAFAFTTPGQASGRVAVTKSTDKLLFAPIVGGVTYGTEHAVLTYEINKTSLYNIVGTFKGSRSGCNAQAYIVYNYNTAVKPFDTTVNYNDSFSFDFAKVALNAGDHISFIVDALDTHANDTIGLTGYINEAQLEAVPEPASIASLLMGLAGVLSIRRRK